jgi:alkylation response protein AidB-like acyl-CoA dehydrogenase
MAKLYASEVAERICSTPSRRWAGPATSRTPAWSDLHGVRGAKIYEGTNDIQRLVISRSLTG